jgi:hypothetical protein
MMRPTTAPTHYFGNAEGSTMPGKPEGIGGNEVERYFLEGRIKVRVSRSLTTG